MPTAYDIQSLASRQQFVYHVPRSGEREPINKYEKRSLRPLSFDMPSLSGSSECSKIDREEAEKRLRKDIS